jgi:microcystin synthetase protein McyD
LIIFQSFVFRASIDSKIDLDGVFSILKMAKCSKLCFIHASGTLKDAALKNQTKAAFYNMYSPKVSGVENILNQLQSRGSLSWLVAFSSIAALLFPAGSSSYGAVNAIMENIVSSSLMKGVRASSIQWGAWKQIGMVSKSVEVEYAMTKLNVSMISPVQGITAFDSLIRCEYMQSLYVLVPFKSTNNVPVCGELQHANGKMAARKVLSHKQGREIVSPTAVKTKVVHILETILGNRIQDESESLISYGADSLCAIEIQNALSKEFLLAIPASFLFDHPSVDSMAAEVLMKLNGAKQETISKPSLNIVLPNIRGANLPSIECMSTREPNGCSRDGINVNDPTRIVTSADRWDVEQIQFHTLRSRFGKFISHVDKFDAELFRVASMEALMMDPQQRLLIEVRTCPCIRPWR